MAGDEVWNRGAHLRARQELCSTCISSAQLIYSFQSSYGDRDFPRSLLGTEPGAGEETKLLNEERQRLKRPLGCRWSGQELAAEQKEQTCVINLIVGFWLHVWRDPAPCTQSVGGAAMRSGTQPQMNLWREVHGQLEKWKGGFVSRLQLCLQRGTNFNDKFQRH